MGRSSINLALPLLVTWIFTNHTNHTSAANDFALVANFFNGCSHLHVQPHIIPIKNSLTHRASNPTWSRPTFSSSPTDTHGAHCFLARIRFFLHRQQPEVDAPATQTGFGTLYLTQRRE